MAGAVALSPFDRALDRGQRGPSARAPYACERIGVKESVLDRLIRRLYRRLGPRYRFVFPLAQDPAALAILMAIE